jgi:hypothetical protein
MEYKTNYSKQNNWDKLDLFNTDKLQKTPDTDKRNQGLY